MLGDRLFLEIQAVRVEMGKFLKASVKLVWCQNCYQTQNNYRVVGPRLYLNYYKITLHCNQNESPLN